MDRHGVQMIKTRRHLAYAVFFAAMVLLHSISVAQVPPQFSGLLTTTTDLTCVGVVPCPTWPMPAMPAAGSGYTDPTWGTTTYRLAVPSANPGQAISTYSRVQAWNSNNTKMFLTEVPGQAYLDLYDATTTPPTPINRITTTDGTNINSYSADALWAFTDPNRIYYVPWASLGHGLELRYVDVSKCTKSNCELKPVVVHTFSCVSDVLSRMGAGVHGNTIETGSGGQGGMFDSTDRYFSFSCDNVNGGGRTVIDFVRYDRKLDKVTTQVKWYSVCPGNVPTGCKVFKRCPAGRGRCDTNIVRMNQHPDANYITLIWQCEASNGNWSIGCGTAGYGPTYNFLGPISASLAHMDNGFDINKVPVTVFIGAMTSTIADAWSIEITNLTTLSPTGITSKVIYLPCQFARVYTGTYPCVGTSLGAKTNATHISMTGSWGAFPGYGLVSTMTLAGAYGSYDVDEPAATTLGTAVTDKGVHTVTPASMKNIAVGVQSLVDYGGPNRETVTWTAVTDSTATAMFRKTHLATARVSNLSAGDTGPFAMENLAVKIDTKAPNGSAAKVYRIGRAMSIRDADYNAEPHTAVNRDFTQITWGSNWNVDGGRDYGFWTKLPIAAPAATSGEGKAP